MTDTPEFPKVHVRQEQVAEAQRELTMFLGSWQGRYSLTTAEYLFLLASEMKNAAGSAVTAERDWFEESD